MNAGVSVGLGVIAAVGVGAAVRGVGLGVRGVDVESVDMAGVAVVAATVAAAGVGSRVGVPDALVMTVAGALDGPDLVVARPLRDPHANRVAATPIAQISERAHMSGERHCSVRVSRGRLQSRVMRRAVVSGSVAKDTHRAPLTAIRSPSR